MEQMRATWTDSRLDDLKEQVTAIDGKVTGLGERVDHLSQRVDEGFGRLDRRMDDAFGRIDGDFGRIDDRIDKLHHSMVHLMAGLVGTIAVLGTALVGAVATHL